MIQPLWRTVWRFLKKLKIELTCDPAIPLLGIYPEKTIIQKESCRNKDADLLENGLEDMGRGKGKLGQSERVIVCIWTYKHYQM